MTGGEGLGVEGHPVAMAVDLVPRRTPPAVDLVGLCSVGDDCRRGLVHQRAEAVALGALEPGELDAGKRREESGALRQRVDAAVAVLEPHAAEALAAARPDAAQLLGVEVHEVAGPGPAVAHHGLARLERAQAMQAVAPEGAVDGRRGELRASGDPGRAAAPRQAQEHDAAQTLADHAQGDA